MRTNRKKKKSTKKNIILSYIGEDGLCSSVVKLKLISRRHAWHVCLCCPTKLCKVGFLETKKKQENNIRKRAKYVVASDERVVAGDWIRRLAVEYRNRYLYIVIFEFRKIED